MLDARLLDPNIGYAYFQKLSAELGEEAIPPTANYLLGDGQLRREWVEIPVPFKGAFMASPDITRKLLKRGDEIGTFSNSSGVVQDTTIRIPNGFERCVLLALPDDGIYNIKQTPYMYLSLAVPEGRIV